MNLFRGNGSLLRLKLQPIPYPSVALHLITLDDAETAVKRPIVVPADIRLGSLHLVIQAAMGWKRPVTTGRLPR